MRSGPSSTPQQPKPKSKSGPKGKGKAAVAESDSELSDVASDDPRAAPIGGRSHQQVLDLIEIMRPGAEESFASRKVFVVERISSVTSAELADIPPAFLPKLYDLSFLLGRYIAVDPNYDLFGHNCWSMAASISYLLRSYFKYYWRRELIEIPLEARPHNLVKQLQDILSSAFGNAKSAEVCYKIELVLGERGTLFRPDRMTLDVHPARGLYHQAKIYSGNLDVEGAAKMLYPLTRQLGWMLDLARFGIDEMLAQFLQLAPPFIS
ncbi:hypothetical protein DL93DRAFT_1754070 [Clavulina sp. PMI_390]|nr:hypothetical protein DL93DRAFT_1754070 [Clavulina sp. PMI_390]